METPQEIVIKEKDELDDKIEKLIHFIRSDEFGKIDESEQTLLRRQETLMELYSETLAGRIANFNQ
jgi:hypothetical protein